MNPDQILVAQQAQALGVGHNLRRPGDFPFSTTTIRALTLARIRHDVDRLITDQDSQRVCETFKHQIEACNSGDLAAQALEEIAR